MTQTRDRLTAEEQGAIEHFKLHGTIVPGYAGVIAGWLGENNGDRDE